MQITVLKIETHAASVVVHTKKDCVQVLCRGTCSKSTQHSPPASLSGSSNNVSTTHLERRLKTAQSNCTQGYVAHFRKNHHRLLLGNWNVLTLTGKELKLVEEAKKYIHIIGVSSNKRCGSGILDLDGWWKLFYLSVDLSMSAQMGLRVLTSLLQMCAFNAVSKYQAFVDDVNKALQRVGSTESTILLRDFNAHIGTNSETWKGVIGRHEDPVFNAVAFNQGSAVQSRGSASLQFITGFKLIIYVASTAYLCFSVRIFFMFIRFQSSLDA